MQADELATLPAHRAVPGTTQRRDPSRLRLASAFALLGASIAALALHCFPYEATYPLDLAALSHWGGNAYAMRIAQQLPKGITGALLQVESDSNETPSVSRLRLFEGNVPLGPGHSLHADIGAKGQGRFSHWRNDLVFSSSDNSDPRKNGRTYAVKLELSPSWALVVGLLIAATVLLPPAGEAGSSRQPTPPQGHMRTLASALVRFFSRHRAHVFWTVAGALGLFMMAIFHLLMAAPVPHPDSNTYLTWSMLRTLGYPFLLHSYHFVFKTWQYLHLYQLGLLLGGLFVLAHALTRVTGSYLVGWLLLCIVTGSATMLLSAADLLTEAPFSAFLMAHVGFAMLFFRSGSRVIALLAGLALAAVVAIKSVAVVLLGPLALAILFLPARRRALFLLVFVPPMLAWLLPSAYNNWRHGVFETSHAGGFALAGHVAWAIHPQPAKSLSAEATIVERSIAPVLARRPASFGSMLQYVDYTANEYNELLWANMVPQLDNYYSGLRLKEPCSWDGRQRGCVVVHTLSLNRTLMQLSREAIAREPRRYAYHVMAHDYGMWRDVFAPPNDFLLGANNSAEMLHAAYDPAKTGYAAHLAPLPPLKSGTQRWSEVSRIRDSGATRFFDLVTLRTAAHAFGAAAYRYPMVSFAVALLGCLLVPRLARLSVAAQAFCYCALCLHAYQLGTALAQPSLVRYAAAMQGLMAATALLAALLAWRIVYDRAWRRWRAGAEAEDLNPETT